MKTITPTISQLRMLASIRGKQWAMRPESVQSYALAALDIPEKASGLSIAVEDFFELRPPAVIDSIGIAHIHVHSALVDSSPAIYEKLGMVTRYSTIQGETEAALEQGAKAILYHVNSPGGTVSGCREVAQMISELPVPTGAFCQGLACSAAYKLAAGCDFILATPSAEVGNIGTIMSWMDCTEFWKSNGIEMKAIVSEGASLKSTGHLEPNAEQVAFLQESVNDAGRIFREHVSLGRGQALAKSGRTLDPEVWKAGWYDGETAESLGLIDGMGTMEDAIRELASFLTV